jgi:hypothetical protein
LARPVTVRSAGAAPSAIAAMMRGERSPDGSRVLTGSFYGTAFLRDATTGKQLRSFRGEDGMNATTVTSVAFSPDGKSVLTGSVGNASVNCAASRSRHGKRAKAASPRCSNCATIAARAPTVRRRVGIGSRVCLIACKEPLRLNVMPHAPYMRRTDSGIIRSRHGWKQKFTQTGVEAKLAI